MRIVFLNPQGNFDANDSHLTEHPDFGGQLVYVKEVAMAMAAAGHKIDIVTRKIDDPEWPEFPRKLILTPTIKTISVSSVSLWQTRVSGQRASLGTSGRIYP